jgi:3-oxoacyl-[acyl-carrier protein] reductase
MVWNEQPRNMALKPTYTGLAGKAAVVVGGSRGIGAAVCRLLAANGARVVVNGRDEEAIDEVIREIRFDGGEAVGVAADCTNYAAIERMRQQVEQEFGPAAVLIIAAGGYGEPAPTAQITEERWRFVMDANLTLAFLTVKSFLPGMIERRHGAIVTVASTAGRAPSRASAAYAAAKAGLVMFTRHVANEVGIHGVRANCVSPGATLTEGGMLSKTPEEVRRQVAALHPLARIGTPEDMAHAILFLASDSASWITGVTLDVAGGAVMV